MVRPRGGSGGRMLMSGAFFSFLFFFALFVMIMVCTRRYCGWLCCVCVSALFLLSCPIRVVVALGLLSPTLSPTDERSWGFVLGVFEIETRGSVWWERKYNHPLLQPPLPLPGYDRVWVCSLSAVFINCGGLVLAKFYHLQKKSKKRSDLRFLWERSANISCCTSSLSGKGFFWFKFCGTLLAFKEDYCKVVVCFTSRSFLWEYLCWRCCLPKHTCAVLVEVLRSFQMCFAKWRYFFIQWRICSSFLLLAEMSVLFDVNIEKWSSNESNRCLLY